MWRSLLASMFEIYDLSSRDTYFYGSNETVNWICIMKFQATQAEVCGTLKVDADRVSKDFCATRSRIMDSVNTVFSYLLKEV